MSDTLIVYYSLEGNVDYLAKSLAKEINADLCRLETVKTYPTKGLFKFLHGGKDAAAGFKPELKTELPDLSAYTKIVIATPVWAGKPAAPINTFLDAADFNGKKIYAIASSAGGNAVKTLEIIKEAVQKKGGTFCASDSFTNPLKKQEIAFAQLKIFSEQI